MNSGRTKFTVYCSVFKGEKLLVLKRKDNGYWELPGGNVEYGEHPEQTARRELKEETNLVAKSCKLLGIGSVVRPDKVHQVSILYDCSVESYEVKLPMEEHTAFEWIRLDELEKLEGISSSLQSLLEVLKNR